ncbi:MAG TPA: glucoamylase family protein, partial [Candidatus Binatia bacterium]|nr:glucoamylase family protein [Candidatus Binatia bacterium]
MMTRRHAMARIGAFILAVPRPGSLLEDLTRSAFLYFWEAADPSTGLVKDRALADGQSDARRVGSIAATGFGLTGLCIGAERGYRDRTEIEQRVLRTLEYLWAHLPNEHGFYYHFIDVTSGARHWNCELSSIDTALLMCGVVTCGQYWSNPQIRKLSQKIYERVDWRWMLNAGECLLHGWKPDSGFLKNHWDAYCEHMLLYLLAIGSPTHPIPPESWHAWRRPVFEYEGLRFITVEAPLFIHQYSHAWFDFAGRRDRYTDYFENSVRATKAHRRFCMN